MNHYNPKHAKLPLPFRETTAFKFAAITAVTPAAAGLAATGGAAATHHSAAYPATYYAVPASGHADPLHTETTGEFTSLPGAAYGSTVATTRVTVYPDGI